MGVEERGDPGVLEALPLHDVAPVARRVADRQEDQLVLGTRLGEGLLTPGEPVNRIVRVLQEVGGVFEDESVGVARPSVGQPVLGARHVGRTLGGQGGVEALLQLGRPGDRDLGRTGDAERGQREDGDCREEMTRVHEGGAAGDAP